ncbi:hypothetical protein J2X47_001652 [Sphingomonas sp. BE270]|jgi:hypothetical protein|uniref:hypothetical protein n=2 Tax=Sphingomonas TaxID=13687 RepID=UPI001485B6DF|nr:MULTISPECIES: hypothetical protein [unclassified Sphingomonas]MDR6849379.1 hypothetical protein [Sphingomonas sp. BE137]MDR7257481.1 hypothetical protein [Sphingomonas sp. BE270]
MVVKMSWTFKQIEEFVASQTGEEPQRAEVEGPAVLGPYTVWRVWTYDGSVYNAHYVVGHELLKELQLFQNFQPFANWLMKAFNATEIHTRGLDWLRSIVASTITLTLLILVVWAVIHDKASGVDFRWLVGALAVTALGYLLGGWTRKSRL